MKVVVIIYIYIYKMKYEIRFDSQGGTKMLALSAKVICSALIIFPAMYLMAKAV